MRTALLACCFGILGCRQSPSEKEDVAVLDVTSLWQRTLGGPQSDSALSGCIAPDGRLVTVGYTESFGSGGADVYLASLDPQGNVLWERTFGGPLDDSGKAVVAPRTGGFLVVGRSTSLLPDRGERSDMFLVRTDSEGNSLWERRVGGRGSEAATGVVETADGAFLVAGWTTSYGPGHRQNVYVVKVTDQGNVLWDEAFGGTGWDEATWIGAVGGDRFVVGGSTDESFSRGRSIYLLGIDGSGKLLWQTFLRDADVRGRRALPREPRPRDRPRC